MEAETGKQMRGKLQRYTDVTHTCPENGRTYNSSCWHRTVAWLICYRSVALACIRCFRGMSETPPTL